MQEYSGTYCLQKVEVLSEFFTESNSPVCGVEFESYILYFFSPFNLRVVLYFSANLLLEKLW